MSYTGTWSSFSLLLDLLLLVIFWRQIRVFFIVFICGFLFLSVYFVFCGVGFLPWVSLINPPSFLAAVVNVLVLLFHVFFYYYYLWVYFVFCCVVSLVPFYISVCVVGGADSFLFRCSFVSSLSVGFLLALFRIPSWPFLFHFCKFIFCAHFPFFLFSFSLLIPSFQSYLNSTRRFVFYGCCFFLFCLFLFRFVSCFSLI